MAHRRLTIKQRLFCANFARENVATVAARQARYREGTARNAANHFLKNPLIVAEIERLQAERKSILPVTTQTKLAKRIRKLAVKLAALARDIQRAEVTA
jgi:phage terminase small subunit